MRKVLFYCLSFLLVIHLDSCKTTLETKEENTQSIKNIENKKGEEKEQKISEFNEKSEKHDENTELAKEKIVEQKEYFDIEIDLIEGKSSVFINGDEKGETPLKVNLEKGNYDLILKRKDYPDQVCKINIDMNKKVVLKHKKEQTSFKEVGVFECGDQPKQVIFSPDDNFIFLPLLDDQGFQIFDLKESKVVNLIKPLRSTEKGFAEGLFVPSKDSFFVSQMTTGYIYEYSYPEMKLKREIQTGGKWPKYIAYSSKLNLIAVSNWSTNNVSIIDYETGKILRFLDTEASPRGIVFTDDGEYIIVLSFDGGTIHKISTKNWKEEKRIYKKNAAMRHIVLNGNNTRAYVSNMYHFEIYEIDVESFKILNTYRVYYNPNTIDLKDDKLLFVSSRGPNDDESYLKRSPQNGKITVIDVEKKEIVGIIEGGNQPTGLDVSNNGKYLCFSNFRDKNIELYYLGD